MGLLKKLKGTTKKVVKKVVKTAVAKPIKSVSKVAERSNIPLLSQAGRATGKAVDQSTAELDRAEGRFDKITDQMVNPLDKAVSTMAQSLGDLGENTIDTTKSLGKNTYDSLGNVGEGLAQGDLKKTAGGVLGIADAAENAALSSSKNIIGHASDYLQSGSDLTGSKELGRYGKNLDREGKQAIDVGGKPALQIAENYFTGGIAGAARQGLQGMQSGGFSGVLTPENMAMAANAYMGGSALGGNITPEQIKASQNLLKGDLKGAAMEGLSRERQALAAGKQLLNSQNLGDLAKNDAVRGLAAQGLSDYTGLDQDLALGATKIATGDSAQNVAMDTAGKKAGLDQSQTNIVKGAAKGESLSGLGTAYVKDKSGYNEVMNKKGELMAKAKNIKRLPSSLIDESGMSLDYLKELDNTELSNIKSKTDQFIQKQVDNAIRDQGIDINTQEGLNQIEDIKNNYLARASSDPQRFFEDVVRPDIKATIQSQRRSAQQEQAKLEEMRKAQGDYQESLKPSMWDKIKREGGKGLSKLGGAAGAVGGFASEFSPQIADVAGGVGAYYNEKKASEKLSQQLKGQANTLSEQNVSSNIMANYKPNAEYEDAAKQVTGFYDQRIANKGLTAEEEQQRELAKREASQFYRGKTKAAEQQEAMTSGGAGRGARSFAAALSAAGDSADRVRQSDLEIEAETSKKLENSYLQKAATTRQMEQDKLQRSLLQSSENVGNIQRASARTDKVLGYEDAANQQEFLKQQGESNLYRNLGSTVGQTISTNRAANREQPQQQQQVAPQQNEQLAQQQQQQQQVRDQNNPNVNRNIASQPKQAIPYTQVPGGTFVEQKVVQPIQQQANDMANKVTNPLNQIKQNMGQAINKPLQKYGKLKKFF